MCDVSMFSYGSHLPSSLILNMNCSAQLMASPGAAAPAEFTQMEAARQSLIAISQSIPEIGAPVIRPPNGGGSGMDENGHEDVAEQRYRAKLISISNQSPDARPTPCPSKNGAA
ncbi:unnamed protein product [Miscanthus lutarioriparius]|uniref:Uncharacterized protein n=1 Tax=Miscanthus lutarioriparius TaxID=422564 RepID=A0A811QG89_9POAL|nr:unnamed protein product [Miscanthus lutarioriparius]